MKHSKIELKLRELEDRIETLDRWTTNTISTLHNEVSALYKRNAESDADWEFYWIMGIRISGIIVVILAILGAGALIGGKL